ncbi:MAG: CCC motif membrane protein [Maribacter sp.]
MEQQKLPNVTLILVLGIISIVLCWCYGILGLILSLIALILAMNTAKIYKLNPEDYTNYSALKTAKIVAIIGLALNLLFISFMVWFVSVLGWDVLMSQDQELIQERMNDLFNN